MKLTDVSIPLHDKLLSQRRYFMRPRTLEEICNKFQVCPAEMKHAITEARLGGLNFIEKPGDEIQLSDELAPRPPTRLHTEKFFKGKWIRFGLVSDSHLCSKYERLDVNETIFDIFKREGISTVYHCGNPIDGEAKGINTNDIHTHGCDNQCAYFLKMWPRRKGIKTYFITGRCHEGWYTKREGIDVGDRIIGMAVTHKDSACRRDDLVYLGHIEHDILCKNDYGNDAWIRLFHPGGGAAYAISYTPQGIVNSYQGGEKPSVLCVGHDHKSGWFAWREVEIFLAATTCDQTPFMRMHKLQASVGARIVELFQAEDGHISRTKSEHFKFYDRRFYQGAKFPANDS